MKLYETKWWDSYCFFKKQNQDDIKKVLAVSPKMLRKKYKGEKKLLKIIVKNKDGEQKCIDIPKERENDFDIRNLEVGMTVFHLVSSEVVEIVKIVDDRPKFTLPFPYMPYRWLSRGSLSAMYPRRAMKTTLTKRFQEDCKEIREKHKALDEYRDKPFFLVRLDPIKGTPDGKENLEKIKFPCWVVYRMGKYQKDKIGMLVTGMPEQELEYQLIDMMEQVPVNEVCTVFRGNDLKTLLNRLYSIEVIKGESQLWKVGKFSV